jgi:hypothetical protein
LQSTRQDTRSLLYLILPAVVLLYSFFPTRTHYWDGVLFALNIEGVQRGELPASMLFHPNHLLYSPLGYIVYQALRTLAFSARAITVLQILNIAAAAVSTLILIGLTRRLTDSRPITAMCALLFAFGATWWKFSTDANSYIIAILFLLLTLRSVLRVPLRLFAAAVFHVLAMLFHELAVFAYIPVLVVIVFDRQPKPRRLWLACLYLFATASCVGAVYLAAYHYTDHTAYPSLFSWIASRSTTSQTTHRFQQLFGSYVLSYVKLFAGGKLSLIRDFFSASETAPFAICAACVASAVYLFRRPRPRAITEAPTNALRVLWAWFASYAIFFLWWEPASAFYKLFVWPQVVLLSGIYVDRSNALRQRAGGLVALALGLAAWNFGAFMFPHSHAAADPVLALAQQIDRELPKSATIYYEAFAPDDWYLAYFAPGRRWLKLPSPGDRTPTEAKNGLVCFETTALDKAERNDGIALQIDPSRRWDLVTRQHNVRLECLTQ